MENHFTELALNLAASETDCPLLARSFYLYRVKNALTMENLARWLGLTNMTELNRLALCLTPRSGNAHTTWEDAFNELVQQFPTLRPTRLQLLVASISPTRAILV